jgi:Flp pilus assembly protein TadG
VIGKFARGEGRFGRLWRSERGVAVVEFALIAPFLIVVLISTTDLALAFYSRSQLSAAVAAGAQYAYLNGQTPAATFIQDVGSVITHAVPVSISAPVVNFNNNTANTGNAASCYCPTGTAQSLVWGNSLACGTACGSQNELTAGGYVLVQASHTFTPLFAADKFLVGNTTMTEYFLVRVD